MYQLTESNKERIEALCEEWQNVTSELDNFAFNLEAFKELAKETFFWLEKYFGESMFPDSIVSLLLCIKEFTCCRNYVSAESDAARFVAETLCNVDDMFGINGAFYQFDPEGERNFRVSLYNSQLEDFYDYEIDTATFDLSELISAIEE